MISRACSAVLAQWTFCAARFEIAGELFEIPVEVIDCLPLCLGRQLPCALPILKPQLALVAHGFVFAHRGLDDTAMPQVRRDPAGVFVEMGGGGAHVLE